MQKKRGICEEHDLQDVLQNVYPSMEQVWNKFKQTFHSWKNI